MEHVRNLFKDSENLDIIVKGTVTGKSVDNLGEVLYQIGTPCGDCFEADERCVYPDVTKPVVVEQFVADWYEENKYNFDYNLWNYIMDWEEQEPSDFHNWFNASKQAFQTIVNMHQFGYEVEKEKRYLVKMRGISSNICYLNRVGNKWIIAGMNEHTGMNIYTKHTREELEQAGFGDVFNNPLFEVEEVTE